MFHQFSVLCLLLCILAGAALGVFLGRADDVGLDTVFAGTRFLEDEFLEGISCLQMPMDSQIWRYTAREFMWVFANLLMLDSHCRLRPLLRKSAKSFCRELGSDMSVAWTNGRVRTEPGVLDCLLMKRGLPAKRASYATLGLLSLRAV